MTQRISHDSVLQPEERLADVVDLRLEASIYGLEFRHPELSARRVLSRGLRAVAVLVLAGVVAGMVVAPIGTVVVLLALMTVVYAVAMTYKLSLFRLSHDQSAVISVSDEEARAVRDDELPMYTVLIPAYHEPDTIAQLIRAIDSLEYPRDLLDVKLLLEADDRLTIDAARAALPGPYVQIVEIPHQEPRTKPKALDYGLLDARGDLVTIFDAEDVPERLQLRRAAVAFERGGPDLVCLQARLSFYNARQNLITKWFTLEYTLWFTYFLPGVVRAGSPVPLGGTSNHFRRGALVEAGAWDPFNVTEDADLGVRLARLHRRVGLLDSETGEEATSDFVNWVKQRSRWYKGYFQTLLVHIRHPRSLWNDLGPRGFLGFTMLVGGTPLMAACNVATWVLTFVWLVLRPGWIDQLFPTWVYYLGLACFALGNAVVVYLGIVAARLSKNDDLVLQALLIPLYWLMMSLAAFKATVQLVFAPSFWEKTVHGMATHRTIDLTIAEADQDEHAEGASRGVTGAPA